ncbi:hypothetical protein ACO0K2_04355 [Undibacterium sp. MH2W]|uniref:hypothetical protein n=1 Tax=Undibacterium sp. MH2W TaxID=3413044 RepID=UPI003BF04433
MSISARRQLRQALLDAIVNAKIQINDTDVSIQSPGDWVSQTNTLPGILLRSSRTSKEPNGRGTQCYTSIITLELESRVMSNSGSDAQDAIEQLDYLIEQAILTSSAFMQLVQQVNVDTETEITAEARNHFAGTKWMLRCEIVEEFDSFVDSTLLYSPVEFTPQVTLS